MLDLVTVTDEILDLYHEAGVRSVRLDFFRHTAMHYFDVQAWLIDAMAQRLVQWRGNAGNNWSIQIQQPHLEFWPGLCEVIRQCPVPVVVDHMALITGVVIATAMQPTYKTVHIYGNLRDADWKLSAKRSGMEICGSRYLHRIGAPTWAHVMRICDG